MTNRTINDERPTYDRSSALVSRRCSTAESAEEFERFHDAFKDELKPRGIVEVHLVADMAEKAWEIRRYRRVKTNLINSARRPGVKKLLESLIERSRELDYTQRETEIYRLTEQWFSDESDKNEVLEIFERFGLDEFAVEAAAMRTAARDLEKLDRLMASQEARLSKALRLLADLRGGFIGQQLRARVDRFIDGKTSCAGRCFEEAPGGGIIRGQRPTNCRQSSQRGPQHRPPIARG